MTDKDYKQPVVLSRDELYRQIWTTPMAKLAAQYGITGTGLAKICNRLSVPCPPRGHWAKKAAGKKVVQYRLPELEANTPREVTITPAQPPAKPTLEQTQMQTEIDNARAKNTAITVPDELKRPHWVIASWLAEHKWLTQEARRDAWGRPPGPFTETDHRRHRILDTLFKVLESKGIAVKQEEYPHRVHLEAQKERVGFQLREKQKQIRRPLTADEERWHWNRERGWVQELQGSGLLVFAIKTWLPGKMRQEWRDERDKRLEDDLPEIVATIELAGPALVKQRQERLEAEHRRLQEEHQRYLERRAREHDEKRWQRFLELAYRCDQAASARRLIAYLEAHSMPEVGNLGGQSAKAWLAWAKDWLSRFDPMLLPPQKILEDFVDVPVL